MLFVCLHNLYLPNEMLYSYVIYDSAIRIVSTVFIDLDDVS